MLVSGYYDRYIRPGVDEYLKRKSCIALEADVCRCIIRKIISKEIDIEKLRLIYIFVTGVCRQ